MQRAFSIVLSGRFRLSLIAMRTASLRHIKKDIRYFMDAGLSCRGYSLEARNDARRIAFEKAYRNEDTEPPDGRGEEIIFQGVRDTV